MKRTGVFSLSLACFRAAGIPLEVWEGPSGDEEGDRRESALISLVAWHGTGGDLCNELSFEAVTGSEGRVWGCRAAMSEGLVGLSGGCCLVVGPERRRLAGLTHGLGCSGLGEGFGREG